MLTQKEIIINRKFLNDNDNRFASALKALGDINRFRIFRMLTIHRKISISTIAKVLKISLPLASLHVKVLTNALLLVKNRSGKTSFLSLERHNPLVRALAPTFRLSIKNNSLKIRYM